MTSISPSGIMDALMREDNFGRKRPRVLVATPRVTEAHLISMMLAAIGPQPVIATSRDEILASLCRDPCAAIILDLDSSVVPPPTLLHYGEGRIHRPPLIGMMDDADFDQDEFNRAERPHALLVRPFLTEDLAAVLAEFQIIPALTEISVQ